MLLLFISILGVFLTVFTTISHAKTNAKNNFDHGFYIGGSYGYGLNAKTSKQLNNTTYSAVKRAYPYAIQGGYAYKYFRLESELKSISIKFKAEPITSDNYLGLLNAIYSYSFSRHIDIGLPLDDISLFIGVGIGAGVSAISGTIEEKYNVKQSSIYPALQGKLGAYYALTTNLDFLIGYSNIQLIGQNTSVQSLDFGIRYNFFNKKPNGMLKYEESKG
ncbi:MAG: hypothetical protein LBQ34_00860 [Alphaproteobacteria bacterium]|jgi:hypothetical protein|nr:hypothetical protein [Alphaproteobacteria bacterium]